MQDRGEAPPRRPGPVLRRALRAGGNAGLRRLEALRCDDGLVRAFYAAGFGPALFDAAPRPGCAAIHELREVGHAALVVAGAGPGLVALALAGGGTDRFDAPAAEPDLLAGRNVLMALRSVEPAAAVAEWLAYHERWHGADGAAILNRAGDGHDAYAQDLAAEMEARGLDLPVVLVECPVPLGLAGAGAESHPFHAPDAPGRDRMDHPQPDPWLAPLGEGLVYEILKWRFLTRARAVLALDVSDLLANPGAQPSAFDRCLDAERGVVTLLGRRTYPWRVRPGMADAFGDHICRPFDARRGIARWGAAPGKAGLDGTWRLARVAFAQPDEAPVAFWRAMGLRVPGRRASELAPKTALIEDPDLLDLAQRCFGANPVRPPASAARDSAPADPAAARTCIVTTMKNEGPFILEWLAHHRAIGVTDFLIYTNDCTDGTDRLLDLLAARGLVVHRDNPYRGSPLPPQHAALQAAESEPVLHSADWAICMDVDEFISIRLGDGRLPALFAAMGDANMISLTWRLFGNADIDGFEDRFVTEQFTLAAPEKVRKPHQAWGFKTLFRTIDIYRKLGVHRPKGLRPELWTEVRWLNGSGRPMPQTMLRNGWRSTAETYGYDWAGLNHYAVRSAESFLVKRDRGRVNHVDRDQGLHYWFRMNHNAVEDQHIQRMIPALRAEYDRLMSDPEIAAAHRACVAAHRTRIAYLLAQPAPAAFHAELTGDRMRQLSRMLHHFGASVFNAGPSVIPPDFHLRDLPADFLFSADHACQAQH